MSQVTTTAVLDASDEIFMLYTQKQKNAENTAGLGFVESNKQTLSISLTVSAPKPSVADTVVVRGAKGAKKKRTSVPQEVSVEIELHQDLAALRNRRGDTGSVLWRVSVHLAQFLLASHHFPPQSPLLPNWSTSTVLELGSGSGFLGLALQSTVKSWTFSDQLASLDLVSKNLRRNGVVTGDVREIDWDAESLEWESGRREKQAVTKCDEMYPDYIVAADCIFNPSISRPLARTIDLWAGPTTITMVASELRDPDPLEEFLVAWLELGWSVERVVFDEKDPSGMGRTSFVLWIGRKLGLAPS